MRWREYPDDIKKDFELCKPYEDKIHNGELIDAPPEVIAAFERTKKWAWEQEQ